MNTNSSEAFDNNSVKAEQIQYDCQDGGKIQGIHNQSFTGENLDKVLDHNDEVLDHNDKVLGHIDKVHGLNDEVLAHDDKDLNHDDDTSTESSVSNDFPSLPDSEIGDTPPDDKR